MHNLALLNVANNRIQDRGGIALVQSIRENHRLRDLILNHNPIGQNGGAAIAHAICNPTRGTRHQLVGHLHIVGCLFHRPRTNAATRRLVSNPGLLPGADEDSPSLAEPPPTAAQRKLWYHYGADACTDRYNLDLSNAYERAIAVWIFERAFLTISDNLENMKLDGQTFAYPEDHSDPESIWLVPWEGQLDFTYKQNKHVPASTDAVCPEVMQRMVRLTKQRQESIGHASALEFVEECVAHLWFTMESATGIADLFGTPDSPFEYANVWVALYPRIIEFWKYRLPIHDRVSSVSQEAAKTFVAGLDVMWMFNPENPTGHYLLDLTIKANRQCALRMQEFSNVERGERKARGMYDLSQKGNQENWRNERYQKRSFTANESFLVPDSGVLELDYVSSRRPPDETTAATPEEFEKFFAELKAQSCPYAALTWLCFGSTRDGLCFDAAQISQILWWFPGHKLPLVLPGEQVSQEEMALRRAEAIAKEDEEMEKLQEALRQNAGGKKKKGGKKSKKKGKAEPEPPPEDEGQARLRCEAAIVLWGRLIEEEDSDIMLESVTKKEYFEKLLPRLGYLTLLNPIKPNNPLMQRYILPLAVYECRQLAEAMLHLGAAEPGENFIDEVFTDPKGKVKERFQVPEAWLEDGVPTEGTLEFTYKAEEDEVLLDKRVELAKGKLGWNFPEDFLERVTKKMQVRWAELKSRKPDEGWGVDGKVHL